jgi:hypothetical protein
MKTVRWLILFGLLVGTLTSSAASGGAVQLVEFPLGLLACNGDNAVVGNCEFTM